MSKVRWTVELHESAHKAKLIDMPVGAKPWAVRDTWHSYPWPRYYEGENGMSAVRFKTQEAAQRCADKLNGAEK